MKTRGRRLLKAAERIIVLTTAAVISGRLWQRGLCGLCFAIIVVGSLGLIAEEGEDCFKNSSDYEEQIRMNYRPKTSTGITISQMALILPTCLIVLVHGGQTTSAAYIPAQALILTTMLNRFLYWAPSWRLYVLVSSFTICLIGSTIFPALLQLFLSGSSSSSDIIIITTTGFDGLRRVLWVSSVIGTQAFMLHMFAVSGFSRSFSRGELELTSVLLSLPMANSVMRLLLRLLLLMQPIQLEEEWKGRNDEGGSCYLIICCSSSSVSGEFALVCEAAIVGILLSIVLSAQFLRNSRSMVLKERKGLCHVEEHKKKSIIATGVLTSSFLSTGYFLAYFYINRNPISWLLKLLQPPLWIMAIILYLLSFSSDVLGNKNDINGSSETATLPASSSVELNGEENPTNAKITPFFIVIYWFIVLIPGIIFSPTPSNYNGQSRYQKSYSSPTTNISTVEIKKKRKQGNEVKERHFHSLLKQNKVDSASFSFYKWNEATISTITARKWYHFLAAIAFTPCIALNPEFMAFAFIGALSLFVIVEALRIGRIYRFYNLISSLFDRYLDSRDEGPLIMSHIYLLLGCALPVFLYLLMDHYRSPLESNHIWWTTALTGIISLGVGDAFASIVGVSYGCRFFPQIPGTNKSFEGMIAGYGSMILTITFISGITLDKFSIEIAFEACHLHAIPAALCASLEVCTDQMDNLFLPTFYFVWLTLCFS